MYTDRRAGRKFMKIMDIKTWKRRAVFENFIGYTNPIFSLSAREDVTALVARCKREGTSFFTDFMYLVTQCLNETEELRLRLVGDDVVLYEHISPSYIVMSDAGVIVTRRTDCVGGYKEFYAQTRRDIAEAKAIKSPQEKFNDRRNDCFYISCLPWTDIRSVINPYDLADREATSIPRLTWGRYAEENGRLRMTLDISAHHALTDGEPLCRAFNLIQDALSDADNWFERN